MHLLAKPAALIGRILLSLLFIVAGAMKFGDIAGTDQYIQSVGMPAGLAIPAALFEIIAGLCILIGFLVRPFFAAFGGLLHRNRDIVSQSGKRSHTGRDVL